jgi:hypothetical protein
VPVLRVSHAVEEVCHRLLILSVGLESVSEASGHLAIKLRGRGQVAPLGEDLGFVDVGVVAGHGHRASSSSARLSRIAESRLQYRAAARRAAAAIQRDSFRQSSGP